MKSQSLPHAGEKPRAASLLPWTASFLAACEATEHQSILDPVSWMSAEAAWLWWFMFGVGGVVFVLVFGLFLYAILMPPADSQSLPPLGKNRFILMGGIIVPTIILVVLLFVALGSTVKFRIPDNTAFTIEVVGHRWWWEIRYPDFGITDANELYIPVGEPVLLRLWSADIIHSFWVPALHGKIDMMPEKVNTFWIEADEPGVYRGQCAEYCGLQHANMAFRVIALATDEFEAWVHHRQQPVPEPETADLQRGREVFFNEGCDVCHAIDGVGGTEEIGPDMTHVASRMTLGAGILPNNRGYLAGWIVNPQALKPGNLMPRSYIEPQDLEALLDYLETLR